MDEMQKELVRIQASIYGLADNVRISPTRSVYVFMNHIIKLGSCRELSCVNLEGGFL